MINTSLPSVTANLPNDVKQWISRVRGIFAATGDATIMTRSDLTDSGLAKLSKSGVLSPAVICTANSRSDFNNLGTTWSDGVSLTLASAGQKLYLQFTAIADWTASTATSKTIISYQLARDNTVLASWQSTVIAGEAISLASSYLDAPSNGQHTYKLQFKSSLSLGSSFYVRSAVIGCIGCTS